MEFLLLQFVELCLDLSELCPDRSCVSGGCGPHLRNEIFAEEEHSGVLSETLEELNFLLCGDMKVLFLFVNFKSLSSGT